MVNTDNKKYLAFISYRHADNKEMGRQWATWLHQAIETYEVPSEFVGTKNGRGEEIPDRIYPVFRDEEELPADSDLGGSITRALDQTRLLIVLCSPRAVESTYVADEIDYFKKLGHSDRIIAAMIDGEPNTSWDKEKLKHGFKVEQECFPIPLQFEYDSSGKPTSKRAEPIAADFRLNNDGKPDEGWTSPQAYRQHLEVDKSLSAKQRTKKIEEYQKQTNIAFLKIVAGVIGVPLSDLTKRDKEYQLALERTKAKKLKQWLSALGILALVAIGSGIAAYINQQEALKQRDRAVDRETLLLVARSEQSYEYARFNEAEELAVKSISPLEDGTKRKILASASLALSKSALANRQNFEHQFSSETDILVSQKSNEVVYGVGRDSKVWEIDTDDDDEITIHFYREAFLSKWLENGSVVMKSLGEKVLKVQSVDNSPYYIADYFNGESHLLGFSDDNEILSFATCGLSNINQRSFEYLAYLEGFRLNANQHLTSDIYGSIWVKKHLGSLYVCNLNEGTSKEITQVYDYKTTGRNSVVFSRPDDLTIPRIVKVSKIVDGCEMETLDLEGKRIKSKKVGGSCLLEGGRWHELSDGVFYDSYFGVERNFCASGKFVKLSITSEAVTGLCDGKTVSLSHPLKDTISKLNLIAEKGINNNHMILLQEQKKITVMNSVTGSSVGFEIQGEIQSITPYRKANGYIIEERIKPEYKAMVRRLHLVKDTREKILHRSKSYSYYSDAVGAPDHPGEVFCESPDGLTKLLRYGLTEDIFVVDFSVNKPEIVKLPLYNNPVSCSISNNNEHIVIAYENNSIREITLYNRVNLELEDSEDTSNVFDLRRVDSYVYSDGGRIKVLNNGEVLDLNSRILRKLESRQEKYSKTLELDFTQYKVNPTNPRQAVHIQYSKLADKSYLNQINFYMDEDVSKQFKFSGEKIIDVEFSKNGQWLMLGSETNKHMVFELQDFSYWEIEENCGYLMDVVSLSIGKGSDEWAIFCSDGLYTVDYETKKVTMIYSNNELDISKYSEQKKQIIGEIFDKQKPYYNLNYYEADVVRFVNNSYLLEKGRKLFQFDQNFKSVNEVGRNFAYDIKQYEAIPDAVFSFSSQDVIMEQRRLKYVMACNQKVYDIELLPEKKDLQITHIKSYGNLMLIFLDEVYGNYQPGSFLVVAELARECSTEGDNLKVSTINIQESDVKKFMETDPVHSIPEKGILLIKNNLYRFNIKNKELTQIAVLSIDAASRLSSDERYLWSLEINYVKSSSEHDFIGAKRVEIPDSSENVVRLYNESNSK